MSLDLSTDRGLQEASITKWVISLKNRRTHELDYDWRSDMIDGKEISLIVYPDVGSYKLSVRLTLDDGRHVVRDLILRVV